jgi:L-asparaginase
MVPPGDGFTIPSGFYNPQKARIVLQLALTVGWGNEEIAEGFARSLPGL